VLLFVLLRLLEQVIKGNVHILFGYESATREEAFSRLCWLLASQTDSREMLPRLNNLHDKALPNACQIQRLLDVNKNRTTQHFYQVRLVNCRIFVHSDCSRAACNKSSSC
jgi:hypothetical protein